MTRVLLKPVSQQQNSIILKPVMATAPTQAQAMVSQYQPFAQSYQIPVGAALAPFAQSYQIPVGATLGPWAQSFGQAWPVSQAWQTMHPGIYAQGLQQGVLSSGLRPGVTAFAQPTTFGAGFYPQAFSLAHNVIEPTVDISETNSEVVLSYELPYVDQSNVNLSVSHDTVTLQANSNQGIFYRTISLPTNIQPEYCEATLTNDILEIRMPKYNQTKRKVNINQQQVQQTQQI